MAGVSWRRGGNQSISVDNLGSVHFSLFLLMGFDSLIGWYLGVARSDLLHDLCRNFMCSLQILACILFQITNF